MSENPGFQWTGDDTIGGVGEVRTSQCCHATEFVSLGMARVGLSEEADMIIMEA